MSEKLYVPYLWCLLGILISVVLPILWAYVRSQFPLPNADQKGLGEIVALWDLVRPYAALGVASALTAVLVVAFAGENLTDFRAAILAGYAWDSTLQKLR
ncbi:hypothetical protein NKH28_03935 [Mesorhizobium sp. M1227]|uniref:hypothetical protein n=1 Tax=Mesorhizobium sp. M1227 TaxID=2957071 RepID=UPI00333E0D52